MPRFIITVGVGTDQHGSALLVPQNETSKRAGEPRITPTDQTRHTWSSKTLDAGCLSQKWFTYSLALGHVDLPYRVTVN